VFSSKPNPVWPAKKSCFILRGYSDQQHEITHHAICNLETYARLDLIQSGFFAFFKDFFQVITKSLPIEVSATVVVTKGEITSPPLRKRKEVRM